MKKSWTVLLIGVMMMSLLAGCGGKAEEGAVSPKPEETKQGTDSSKLAFSISFSTGGNTYIESSPDINKDKWVLKLEEMTNTDLDIR